MMPYPPVIPRRLVGAQPLCPLHGIPPVERAWSAKRGDTVFLRMPHSTTPAGFEQARATADRATRETGVYFVLLAAGVEIVPPGEPGDPGPIDTVGLMEKT